MIGKKESYEDNYKAIVAKFRALALGNEKRTQQLIDALQQRFKLAEQHKMDIAAFLKEEDKFVSDLLVKAEQERHQQEERLERRAQFSTIIDNHFEGSEKAISIYKPLPLEDSNNDELMRLFGAIDQLDRDYWSTISSFLREHFPLRVKSPLETIENQLWSLVPGQVGRPPQVLSYYCDCVRRHDTEKMDNAAFEAIKEASFFLNDLLKLLKSVNFPEDNKAMVFLVNIIQNFRIGDIKRKKV